MQKTREQARHCGHPHEPVVPSWGSPLRHGVGRLCGQRARDEGRRRGKASQQAPVRTNAEPHNSPAPGAAPPGRHPQPERGHGGRPAPCRAAKVIAQQAEPQCRAVLCRADPPRASLAAAGKHCARLHEPSAHSGLPGPARDPAPSPPESSPGAMAAASSTVLADRIRGCLVGSLVADAAGMVSGHVTRDASPAHEATPGCKGRGPRRRVAARSRGQVRPWRVVRAAVGWATRRLAPVPATSLR